MGNQGAALFAGQSAPCARRCGLPAHAVDQHFSCFLLHAGHADRGAFVLASGPPDTRWSCQGGLLRAGDEMLHIGQILYDNDPRYSVRTVEIIRIEQRYLVCKCGPREVIIRHDRVHSDAEQLRSGYSLVPPRAIAGREKPNRGEARLLEAELRASTRRAEHDGDTCSDQQAKGKNESPR
jgi:hypothetical protein